MFGSGSDPNEFGLRFATVRAKLTSTGRHAPSRARVRLSNEFGLRSATVRAKLTSTGRHAPSRARGYLCSVFAPRRAVFKCRVIQTLLFFSMGMVMKEYKNYIFDLYGTLLDISTDERKPSLWKLLAEQFNVYGCNWTGKALSEAFWREDFEERQRYRREKKTEHPEIKLENVFARLFFETPVSHRSAARIGGTPVDELRGMYAGKDKEKALKIVAESEFIFCMLNLFRVHSRKLMRPYKNTISTLKKLKEEGKGVYLLSNAQRIFTYPEIEQSGILPYFDAIYISSDLEMMKPQKEFMEALLKGEKLKKSECVMVGNDPDSDFRVAVRNGMDCILLNTWGWSSQKIKKITSEIIKAEGADKKLAPQVIMSGDIGEILYKDK